MSLHWSVKDVKDHEALCFEEDGQTVKGLTWTLILSTMNVGIGRITADNAPKFYARISLIEKLFGALLRRVVDGKPVDVLFEPEWIWQHVGLYTNVSFESDAKWRKRILDSFERDAQAKAARAKPTT